MSLADIRTSLGARDRQLQALNAIAAAPHMEVDSERLCWLIYGATDPKARTAMRVTINSLRRVCAEHGWLLAGQKELRRRAYRLVQVL
jgi:hypothetical protein